MIRIDSNIDEILDDFIRAEEKLVEIPEVLQPSIYVPDLKDWAHQVLNYITAPTEKPLIPVLLDTLMGYVLGDTVTFEMVAASANNALNVEPGQLGFDRLKPLEQEIAEWVSKFKEKSAEDIRRYPDDLKLARHIIGTLKNDPEPWMASKNPEGLLAFLQNNAGDKLTTALGLTPLGEDRASELLMAVLAFWHERIGVNVQSVAVNRITQVLGPDRI